MNVEYVVLSSESVFLTINGNSDVRKGRDFTAVNSVLKEHNKGSNVLVSVLTSPARVDLAPMAVASLVTSAVGPAMSEVPVSTIPLQPPSQRLKLPAIMLENKKLFQIR